MDLEIKGSEIRKSDGRVYRLMHVTVAGESGIEVQVLKRMFSQEHLRKVTQELELNEKKIKELDAICETINAFPDDLNEMDSPEMSTKILKAIDKLRALTAATHGHSTLLPADLAYIQSTRDFKPKSKGEAQLHVNRLRSIINKISPYGELAAKRQLLSMMVDMLQEATNELPDSDPATMN
jgi:hypothetical protein